MLRYGGVALALLVLLVGTALVFEAFDRHAHSASDTPRPFIMTMAPVWALALAAGWVLLRANTAGERE